VTAVITPGSYLGFVGNKVYILSLVLILIFAESGAQTCCSGGVPLTGNLGMPASSSGSWQFSLSYDHNRMSNLLEGSTRVDEDSRSRLTRSVLFESAYSISNRIYLSGLLTYVFQQRTIDYLGGGTTDRISSLGDAVFLLTYRLGGSSMQKWEFLVGAGPKIPLGRSDLRSPVGILYNADMQPGSGAWDAIVWGLLSRSEVIRPTTQLSIRYIYRYTGTNPDYLGSNSYRFGNETQVIAGISDSFLLGSLIVDPSLMLRFRYAEGDISNGFNLPNTGGRWMYLVPGITYNLTPDMHMGISGEIPLYTYLDGIQLSTDFRVRAGIYLRLSGKEKGINLIN